ncbi:50S ribosomal protein L24 [Helicobacter sp. MIT 00-7814]|uniref:50S ribosomal protein L24 n=1 Tax=Helicobacter TaxID=209 RepID=UPI000E1E7602|nr:MULTISPECIES: 50S ribosomal protein L24 [Helicobacter]RDU54374.1 50S ribosomal protein L24 [Helicobacter sp. MIT 99-10781]RDU54451.1 50S ribosomal protein L24 [Helicobacter sp. MIT 00-7814]
MVIKYKIKKGDMVKVIAGDDKGKSGKVLQVLPKKGQVVVEGLKLAKKAIKPSDKDPKGGFITKEMPMSISNVAKVEGDK